MSLQQMLVGAHIIETSDSYSRADDPIRQSGFAPAQAEAAQPLQPDYLRDDQFWEEVIHNPAVARRKQFVFENVTISEWVARVPGLAWSEEAVRFRNSVEHVERMIGGYAYTPPVKSAHVMSGVGTLRLAPATDGSALVSLSVFGDAALGVPALISADVFDKIQVEGSLEGRVIAGKARWMPMAETWAVNFPDVGRLPRGYLLLNQPDQVTVLERRARTLIYPFTVMQYESGASELFDYVYAGANTDEKDHRLELENFFKRYQTDIGANAEYLFNGDMIDQLWTARFLSPEHLRRADPGAESQLDLLEERVRERYMGKTDLEVLLSRMGEMLNEDNAKDISDEIGLSYSLWHVAGVTEAEMCSMLLQAAIEKKLLEALVKRLAVRNPALFQGG